MSNVKHSQNGTYGKTLVDDRLFTDDRINSQLDKGGKPLIKDLKTDLSDGVRLLYLLVSSLKM